MISLLWRLKVRDKNIDTQIATVFGLGFIGSAPGTNGTAVAFFLHLILGAISPWLVLVTVLMGIWASHSYSKKNGKSDPGEVIIDEVAGYWVSVLFLPVSFAFVAFLLFRLVDIIKPFPVNRMEKLPGGIGIMADDLCAGVVVNILLRTLQWLFFLGGFEFLKLWIE